MPSKENPPHEAAPDADATLVARMRDGDREAATVLARRYLRAAYAVALAVTGNRHDAEDVAQEAFVTAIGRIDECRQPDRFAGWLMTIVRNRARNLRTDVRVVRADPFDDEAAAKVDEAQAGTTATADPQDTAARGELAATLLVALATLTEAQREVVLLHDLQGWRHSEIGEALGLSEGMSRQLLFTAHRKLREHLPARAFPGGFDG